MKRKREVGDESKKGKRRGEKKRKVVAYAPDDYPIRYGEQGCEHKGCSNKAYWLVGDVRHLCGVHSKKHVDTRLQLREMPKAERLERDNKARVAHEATCEDARRTNVEAKRVGTVTLYRMRMLKEPGYVPGSINVFPNYKHAGRKDGLGFKTLSPMYLGPVDHGQPHLPPARNIENLHQLALKCWIEECVPSDTPMPIEYNAHENTTAQQRAREAVLLRPGPLFVSNRLAGLVNPIPQRHKYTSSHDAVNRNIPVCAVWVDKSGQEHYLSYVNSRQVYCNFYERLVLQQDEYVRLAALVRDGSNVRLCGYDAIPVVGTLEQAYLDRSAPFGHERVLLTMLTLPEAEWPWRRHKTLEF